MRCLYIRHFEKPRSLGHHWYFQKFCLTCNISLKGMQNLTVELSEAEESLTFCLEIPWCNIQNVLTAWTKHTCQKNKYIYLKKQLCKMSFSDANPGSSSKLFRTDRRPFPSAILYCTNGNELSEHRAGEPDI